MLSSEWRSGRSMLRPYKNKASPQMPNWPVVVLLLRARRFPNGDNQKSFSTES
jgi:hypothetical protein